MITSIHIGTERLELFEDENIVIKSSVAKIEDITKIFTDISNDFTVPASDHNSVIFNHWYESNVINGFDARKKVPATIEISGINFKVGKIRLKKVNFKHNQPSSYSVEFFGLLVEIKDLLQDDKLTDLDLSSLDFEYSSGAVFGRFQIVLDLSFSLLSKRRLLYDSGGGILDTDKQTNIYYNGTDINTGLKPSDLTGSVRQIKIIEAIETKYGFTFSRDYFGGYDFDNQFMALSGTDDATEVQIPLISEPLNTDPTVVGNTMMTAGVGTSFERETSQFQLSIFPDSGYEDVVYSAYIKMNDAIIGKRENITGNLSGNNNLKVNSTAINGVIENITFWIEASENIIFYARVRRFSPSAIVGQYRLDMPNISPQINYIVANRLPDIKIIDYIKGLFKMSKLVAIPQKDGTIYVDSLQQYYKKGKVYDLSDHIEYDKHTVSAGKILNEINYQFEEPQTILNQQFVKNNDRGYGDLELKIYEDLNADPKVLIDGTKLDFKLPFEQIVYEKIVDISDSDTDTFLQYGLLQDENSEFVTIKPHIHYIENFAANLKVVRDDNTATKLRYINVPLHILNQSLQTFSTTFRNEFSTYDGNSIDNNLYTNYHRQYIESIFNIQKREYNFKAIEVPTQIVLNLNLNDVIQIKEKYFRIDSFDTNTNNNNIQFKLINDRVVDLSPICPIGADNATITTDSTVVTADVIALRCNETTENSTPIPPIADASATPTSIVVGNNVNLDGSLSTDADGTIINYFWSSTGGTITNNNTSSPTGTLLSGLTEGSYTITLTVKDNENLTATDSIVVNVVAVIIYQNEEQSVPFTKNNCPTGSVGSVVNYIVPANSFQSNISVEDANIIARNALSTIADGQENANTLGTCSVPPVADAGDDQVIQLPINSVVLDGSGSFDPDGGTIISYLWGVSSGTLSDNSIVNPTWSGLSLGINAAQLFVIDNDLGTDSDTMFVTVQDANVIECNTAKSSGGVGITELLVNLETIGGLITMIFNPIGVPDKLEIIHNGVKKATSGMTTANAGPFDNTTGDPNVPTEIEADTIDQYIGTNKGSIQSRLFTYQSETGSSISIFPPYKQIIWWEYTESDVIINPVAVIRVSGPLGTGWEIERKCE